jgi:hypothetical protein
MARAKMKMNDKVPPQFYETRVTLNESPPFRAWTTGALWNGWATPYFEKKEADRVLVELASSPEDEGGPHRAYHDRARDAYVVQWYDSPKEGVDVWKAETITTPKGKRKVYGIGAYAYTWWPGK